MILDKIVQRKKETIAETLSGFSIEKAVEQILQMPVPRSFHDALNKPGLSIIGEIKRASPSKGMIKKDLEPGKAAKVYETTVDAISVLTEEHHFLGSSKDLEEVSKTVSLPLLRKDFIIDERQIYEGRLLGASTILLIASILDKEQLKEFIRIARSIQMEPLIEVHTGDEVEKAMEAGAGIIGINNRNLMDFTVDLSTTARLRPLIPKDILVVSESGIHQREDVRFLKEVGVDGILVGESFMKTGSIAEKAKEFRKAYGCEG